VSVGYRIIKAEAEHCTYLVPISTGPQSKGPVLPGTQPSDVWSEGETLAAQCYSGTKAKQTAF